MKFGVPAIDVGKKPKYIYGMYVYVHAIHRHLTITALEVDY